MKKSIKISNNFCPQTLFVYGTYKEDKTPNFGLFCWLSYYWDDGLEIMACIGEKKLTKERIQSNRIFSANLVTEEVLSIADYFGNKAGYSADKMNIDVEVEKGQVLDVPILKKSPWIYELEVKQSINFGESDIFLCKIKNILADEILCDETVPVEKRIKTIRPVHTTCQTYFGWNGNALCSWGKAMKNG
jgi:flavin reductase (DIM6/NTAB) family NADH-FMN oxidoreductase RutF